MKPNRDTEKSRGQNRNAIWKQESKHPVRLGILGSSRGTDLQYIIDAIQAGELNARVSVVISNKSKAYILERARQHKIPAESVSIKNAEGVKLDRESYDAQISGILEDYNVDLVLLIGYMRILSPQFCRRWEGRALNVHPSLLPEFAGGMDENVHAAVLASGKMETGCTVHLVTPDVDKGGIIIQKRCPVLPGDDAASLKRRVQDLEGKALAEAIQEFERNGVWKA